MSLEVEAGAAGTHGRYKSVVKAPLILNPCQHLVEKEGRVRKKLILIHGTANGSTKVRKVTV